MKDLEYQTEDLIAALATPWGESALAVIRTSGPGCIGAVATVFSRPEALKRAEGFTIHYGFILDPQEGEKVDEITAAVYREGRSYTGQESVELFVHGSLPGISRIMKVLKKAGFRNAAPGEFTLRAFLAGKMDLTQAEAVHEIVTSKTNRAQALAMNRLGGSVQNKINGVKEGLLHFLSAMSLELDYAEDEIEEIPLPRERILEAAKEIDQLLETYQTGRIYQEGVRVVLAGKTNAGKSSLFNLFLKEDRSIVSDVHGTTRDYLESWISLAGIPVRLFDTAGLRESLDPVEQEGIRRTSDIVQNAALILYLVDGTKGLDKEDRDFLERFQGDQRLIPLWNKVDLPEVLPLPEGFVSLSAGEGEGFSALEREVEQRILRHGAPLQGDVVIDSQRQRDLLEKCREALRQTLAGLDQGMPLDMVAIDLKDALDALGEITGEVSSADILKTMFSNFCVGK